MPYPYHNTFPRFSKTDGEPLNCAWQEILQASLSRCAALSLPGCGIDTLTQGRCGFYGVPFFSLKHQDIITLLFLSLLLFHKSSYIFCSNHQLFQYQVKSIDTEYGLFQYRLHMSQPNCCSQEKERTASTTRCCFHLWHFQLSNALSCRFHHCAQSAPVASASDVPPSSALRDLGSLGCDQSTC